jgi:hypothetical protein
MSGRPTRVGRVLQVAVGSDPRPFRPAHPSPALLLLARYDTQDKPERVVPKISQETLAEMIGATRSRVNFLSCILNSVIQN